MQTRVTHSGEKRVVPNVILSVNPNAMPRAPSTCWWSEGRVPIGGILKCTMRGQLLRRSAETLSGKNGCVY
eukprot:11208089-Lingulodinium_polyedra.AAC.1